MIEKFGKKALERFLSSDEIELGNSSKSYAGFWASKEAISKALGTGIGRECSFFDIKLQKDAKGKPYFLLSKKLVEKFAITDTSLSITHDGEYAVAVAVIEATFDKERDLSF
jgi:holo-[acyl-carrier protein] synthase